MPTEPRDSIWERLFLRENLNWAWRKARATYARGDMLYSARDVAAFNLDLEGQLDSIQNDLRDGTYTLAPMFLLPEPKRPDGERSRMRQNFRLSVRDQVTWIAVVNAIGPTLDSLMPSWSYGHRLHRPAWIPDEDGQIRRTKVGPYRHSSARLYRGFRQSWPLYRRHIVLAARQLASDGIVVEDLDEGERRAYDDEKLHAAPYMAPGYFGQPADGIAYFASLDLRHF